MAASLAIHGPCHAQPPAMHAPPSYHTCPLPTMHALLAMHTRCHACPLPCMVPAVHAPLPCHACTPPLPCMSPYLSCMPPPLPHMLPTMHAPLLCHTCPTMHAPCHTSHPAVHVPPPETQGMIHACENITFRQLLLRTVKIKWVLDRSKKRERWRSVWTRLHRAHT